MKKFTGKLLVGALVVAVAAIGATPALAAKGGTDRPFTAGGSGTNIIETIGDCDFVPDAALGPALVCDQAVELDFAGTHIGRSAYAGVGLITLYVFSPSCITPGGGSGVVFESFLAVTIVAANGDELAADTNVSGCGDGETLAEPAGTFTITGGTGRFATATGTGDLVGEAIGSLLSNNWTGTISY